MAVSKRKPVKKVVVETPQICAKCGDKGEFYSSKSLMHTKWGKLPYCKVCLVELFQELHKKLDDKEKAMIELCKLVNVPYRMESFKNAKEKFEESGTEMISGYFSHYSHTRIKPEDTFFDSDICKIIVKEEPVDIDGEEKEDFEQTEDQILFGKGFSDEEYWEMRILYDDLRNNFPLVTNLHKEGLVKYVRCAVKERIAIAADDIDNAKKWGAMANKHAENAKLNPSQFNKADLAGGCNSFGEVFQAIEKAKEVIPILPRFKYRPDDAIDFLLWDYMDYSRHVDGLPSCSYPDIYKFYDEKKKNYILTTGDPYGIYKDDPTENNREKIVRFIADAEKDELESLEGDNNGNTED